MNNSPVKSNLELRLIFQASIPFEEPAQAEAWYAMLKEIVKTQSSKATLNGQILKGLEPCCGEKPKLNLSVEVPNIGPKGDR